MIARTAIADSGRYGARAVTNTVAQAQAGRPSVRYAAIA